MFVINSSDINYAYLYVLQMFDDDEAVYEANSRNGKVLRAKYPVALNHHDPLKRVLFDKQRDANPFFHLFEAMWMLAGRQDVTFPSLFAKQIREYSDDGMVLHGAYGHRWRSHFHHDQLEWVIRHLRQYPDSRRAVIQMYDAYSDHEMTDAGGKDIPCNTQVFFSKNHEGKLNMTVTNRSNDAIWGALGANFVHFSFLHEFVAAGVGMELGDYYQISNDFHIYDHHWPLITTRRMMVPELDYSVGPMNTVPLVGDEGWELFLKEIEEWCHCPGLTHVKSDFILGVLNPMYEAWRAHKTGDDEQALSMLGEVESDDWDVGARLWIRRRIKNDSK